MKTGYNLISIIGPTASGKTRIGAEVASKYNGSILSADSRQVYKGLNLGTGKDYDSYNVNGFAVPYFLIDIVSPDTQYNFFSYIQDFEDCYSKILSEKKLPILVGGSGLYISAIIQNYLPPVSDFNNERIAELSEKDNEYLKDLLLRLNPSLHNNTDLKDKQRLIKAILISESAASKVKRKFTIRSLNFLIDPGKDKGNRLIKERLEQRLKAGLIREVEELLQSLSKEKLYFFGLEYRYVSAFVLGELSYNDMFQKLVSAIRKFAKKQRTWFRKMENEGIELIKITDGNAGKIIEVIAEKRKAGELSEILPA